MPDAPRPRRPNDPIPETLEEIEADIDHWTGQLSECSMGSESFNAVEVRLRQLARAKERSLSPGTASNPQGGAVEPDPRRVFVVHGRNLKARDSMFTFLRAVNVDPIEWSEAVSLTGEGSPFNGQALERAFSEAKAVGLDYGRRPGTPRSSILNGQRPRLREKAHAPSPSQRAV